MQATQGLTYSKEQYFYLALNQVIRFIQLDQSEMAWWKQTSQNKSGDLTTLPDTLRQKLLNFSNQYYNTPHYSQYCQTIYTILTDPQGL
jgi:hypothetical protein